MYDVPRPGAVNMALDDAMARTLGRDADASGREAAGVVRLYAWTRPTVSFGRNEPARGLWSEAEAARRGMDLVRRPTGGRVVLHDAEVTYAVLVPARAMGGPRQAYLQINRALAAAMRALGADVETAGPLDDGGASRPGSSRHDVARQGAVPSLPLDAGPCFQSPATGEVVALGRKLVGSAQARVGRVLLQHGSIILAGDQSPLAALNPDAAGFERPAALEELLGRPVEFDAVARAVAEAMRDAFGGDWTPSEVGADELTRAHALVEERYGRPDWTWRR